MVAWQLVIISFKQIAVGRKTMSMMDLAIVTVSNIPTAKTVLQSYDANIAKTKTIVMSTTHTFDLISQEI